MQYRPLDATGDYTVGRPFLADSPECVAQAIATRLKLWLGEWFVDTTDGTPWPTQILGKHTPSSVDAAIKQRILGTPGVVQILAYSGAQNGSARTYSVTATVQTMYSTTPVTVSV